jgi:Xaa-Pro aminopeptidase
VTASTIMQEAAQEMERVLARSRFSKPIYETAARKFVEDYKAEAQSPDASLGHWVGMATHDVGHDTGPLRPGMVFTIEPQLRVPEEKIYIRLEDMIVITDKGADILTDFVPMDINGIEKLMREQGILQRYPRENMK